MTAPSLTCPGRVARHLPGFYYLHLVGVAVLLTTAATACASAGEKASASPAAPDRALVDSAEQATAPKRPQHVTFDWALTDRDARFSGKGVVRVAPPYRARLDLFGPRGEAYVIAVLDGEKLSLRPAAANEMLPPPAFLWASLGVFRKPVQPLTASRRTDGGIELTFAAGEDRWQFSFTADGLRRAEWQGSDGGRRTVELTGRTAERLPQRGAFRDWVAFRELTLTVTGVETVDGFAADIWDLDAR